VFLQASLEVRLERGDSLVGSLEDVFRGGLLAVTVGKERLEVGLVEWVPAIG